MNDQICIHLSDKELKKLQLGQKVSATVQGTVQELAAAYKPSKAEKEEGFAGPYSGKGRAYLNISKIKLEEENEFSDLDKAMENETE